MNFLWMAGLLASSVATVVIVIRTARRRPHLHSSLSTGQLGMARRRLRRSIDTVEPFLRQGMPLVVLEPSCAALLRDDLRSLLGDGQRVRRLAGATSTLAELLELDAFVRNHTVDSFGPVRQVEPKLVFEVAFDSVHRSTRHKSGVAMRFPRIHRIRWDKPAEEADRLETLLGMIVE